jgi:hypothetical protein
VAARVAGESGPVVAALVVGSTALRRCSERADLDVVLITAAPAGPERFSSQVVDGVRVEVERIDRRRALALTEGTGWVWELREAARLGCGVAVYDPTGFGAELAARAASMRPRPARVEATLRQVYLALVTLGRGEGDADSLRGCLDNLALLALLERPRRYQKPKWVLADLLDAGELDLADALLAAYQGPSAPLSGKQGPSGPLSGKQGPSGPLSGKHGPSGPLSGKHGPSGPLSGKHGPSGPLSGQQGPSGPLSGQQSPSALAGARAVVEATFAIAGLPSPGEVLAMGHAPIYAEASYVARCLDDAEDLEASGRSVEAGYVAAFTARLAAGLLRGQGPSGPLSGEQGPSGPVSGQQGSVVGTFAEWGGDELAGRYLSLFGAGAGPKRPSGRLLAAALAAADARCERLECPA